MEEAMKGLAEIFGAGKIQSFPGGFDEEAYAKSTMTRYRRIAEGVLKDRNPKEYRKMRASGELKEFLDQVQEDYSQEEMNRVQAAVPDPPQDYQKRVQAYEQAKEVAREFLIAELVEELSAS